ncbi:MAG: purine-binding chemotaxis protein CheW [Desulfobacterales bacterium]|nr:purine-binding chemotaxis protein CheW [Desulfobacterales bacterium]
MKDDTYDYIDDTFDNMVSSEGDQYVTFTVAEEEYGIDILQVQEIISYKGFTKIPNVSSFVKGVLNLRGAVVPVIDLRIKFKMEEKKYNKYTVIVIVVVSGKTMGIIVDAVSDVVGLNKNEIQPTPEFAAKINTDFIKGMGKKKDSFIILLDIEKILSFEEFQQVSAIIK